MLEKTIKEILSGINDQLADQRKDIVEIKSYLKGNEYHREGAIDQINHNTKCISNIVKDVIPGVKMEISDVEKNMEKRTGIIGSIAGILTIAITTLLNWLIFMWRK